MRVQYDLYLRHVTDPTSSHWKNQGDFLFAMADEVATVIAARVNEGDKDHDVLILLPGLRIGWVYERPTLLARFTG